MASAMQPRPDSGRDLDHQRFYSACYAPFTSLHLEPDGNVKACCMNQWHPLGNLHHSTLREIWDGQPAQGLREALLREDFSLGCEQCASHIERGTPESAQLRVFDDYVATGPASSWPTSLELALSNTCNLQCVMCNGSLSSSIRAQREHRPPLAHPYDDDFLAELDEFLPHLSSITFLGGEPFLARSSLHVMERLVELGLSPACSVITNGTQMNDRVRRLVRALPMHVSISVDAMTPTVLESIRVGVDAATLRSHIEEFRALTHQSGGGIAISFSLMRQNWHELGAVLAWADVLDCDVFVVKVFNPGKFSLHHSSAAEIAHIVARMEEEDRRLAPTLGRNASRWQNQLDWVRRLATERVSETTSTTPVSLSRQTARTTGVLRTNGDLMLQDVDPPDLAIGGLEVAPFVGRTLVDVQRALMARLGPINSSDVNYFDDGRQENTLTFGGEPAVVVRTTMTVDQRGRQIWRVGTDGAD